MRAEAVELARGGARVVVYTPSITTDATARADFFDDRVEVVRLGGASAFGPPGALARIAAFPPRLASAAAWAWRAHAALRRESFDRVISHWAVPSAWPVAPASAPLEVVSHGSDVRLLVKLPSPLRHAIASKLAARARVWRFVSTPLLDALAASLRPELARRVAHIAEVRPAAFELPDVRARATALKRELGSFRVSVGRLVPSKRVDRAIDRVAADGGLLVVVGDGPERRSLERHARRRGVDARFVGELPRDEALAYLAAADALVFASESEGCSTVLREASALETPVELLS